jgi:hypothetical protein
MGPQAFFLVPPFDVSNGCQSLTTRFPGDLPVWRQIVWRVQG